MKTYLVGGAIRDQLLGLKPRESDWLVVGATAAEMSALGYRAIGKNFPVFLHPDTHEEYALARTERKSGVGHQGFTFYTSPDISVEEDLSRRDLTINAIAQCPDTQALIDPYHGQKDLANKWLRHVSPAFSEDPLRVLRVARFAAKLQHLGFNIHPDTLALMRAIVTAGELGTLSKERIWQEFDKALRCPTPAAFFDTLINCNALPAISPALAAVYSHPATPSNADALNNTPLQQHTTMRFAQLWHNAEQHLHSHDLSAAISALQAPKHHQQLALHVAQHQQTFHRAHTLGANHIAQLFNQLGAWRNPKLTAAFIDTCSIRGNTANAILLQRCYRAAAAVEPTQLINMGYSGKALGIAIEDERIRLIARELVDAAPPN